MKERYLLEDWIYDNENLQRRAIQLIADLNKDKYNKIYETTQYHYDPIANVDADETETRTITGTRTSTRTLNTDTTRTPNITTANVGVKETITPGDETTTEYNNPVVGTTSRAIGKRTVAAEASTTEHDGSVTMTGTETTSDTGTIADVESFNNYKDELHRIRKGNIGVTMTQQLIEAERRIIIKLEEMYLEEFSSAFMITM